MRRTTWLRASQWGVLKPWHPDLLIGRPLSCMLISYDFNSCSLRRTHCLQFQPGSFATLQIFAKHPLDLLSWASDVLPKVCQPGSSGLVCAEFGQEISFPRSLRSFVRWIGFRRQSWCQCEIWVWKREKGVCGGWVLSMLRWIPGSMKWLWFDFRDSKNVGLSKGLQDDPGKLCMLCWQPFFQLRSNHYKLMFQTCVIGVASVRRYMQRHGRRVRILDGMILFRNTKLHFPWCSSPMLMDVSPFYEVSKTSHPHPIWASFRPTGDFHAFRSFFGNDGPLQARTADSSFAQKWTIVTQKSFWKFASTAESNRPMISLFWLLDLWISGPQVASILRGWSFCWRKAGLHRVACWAGYEAPVLGTRTASKGDKVIVIIRWQSQSFLGSKDDFQFFIYQTSVEKGGNGLCKCKEIFFCQWRTWSLQES